MELVSRGGSWSLYLLLDFVGFTGLVKGPLDEAAQYHGVRT